MRIRYLDGLRGIAAFTVMVFHITMNNNWVLEKNPASLNRTLDVLECILFNGKASVALFFVLSGFVLTIPFKEGKVNLKNFYVRRLFRIYPAYFVAIIFAFLLMKESWKTFFDELFFIRTSYYQLIPVAWSLRIELIYSILFPALVFILKKNKKVALPVLLALVCFFDILYLLHFTLGIMLCLWYDDIIALPIRKTGLWLLAVIGFLLYNSYYILSLTSYADYQNNFNLYFTAGLGAAILLVIVFKSIALQNILQRKAPLFLGKISYSLYLVHTLVLHVYNTFSTAVESQLHSALAMRLISYPFTICISVFVGYFMSRYIEAPAIRWGKELTKAG